MEGPDAHGDVNWEQLDKRKFFLQGGVLFSTLTAALFPLTVIKTRMMALDGAASPSGIRGALHTGRSIVSHDGVRGLYKGFGTVLCGAIPARVVYLATLESARTFVAASLPLTPLAEAPAPVAASMANFVAGGMASMAGQLVIVPIDVISQRQMISGGGGGGSGSSANPNGVKSSPESGMHVVRQILRRDGARGLYRGFGASIATFVPSSAIWWAAYGGWQSTIWGWLGDDESSNTIGNGRGRRDGAALPDARMLSVQIGAGILTGMTSASLTTPLDVVKTRLQTANIGDEAGSGRRGAQPTWRATAAALFRAEGAAGFFRGLAPRMVSTSIWGTTMVTAYEYLKRLCVLPAPEGALGGGGEFLTDSRAAVEVEINLDCK